MSRMSRTMLFFFAVGSAAWAADVARARPQQSTAGIMQQKMVEAQQLLEALVLKEFAKIEEHSTELYTLAEFQSWFVLPTPEYAQHSREFREAAQGVAEAGKKGQVEMATEAYMSLVRQCVQCHEYMRRVPGGVEK